MGVIDQITEKPRLNHWVIGILLAALLLRGNLVFQGGQYYFSDEQRYQNSQTMAELLLQGQVREAARQLFSPPEHLGYKLIGIIPALLERLVGSSLVLPALFFSLFSVLNLYLIFLLARRAGASPLEALFALAFAALSQCLFFYARHFMPYDVALTFGLLALYVGLADKPGKGTSMACGGLSLLCFVTYNGYWTLAGLALLVHIFYESQTVRHFLQKGIFLGAGFILPLFALIVASAQVGINLLEEYRRFAQTITQGSYEEGWSLPFAYFWHTEHFLFIALALLALYAVLTRRNHRPVFIWSGCILFIYLCLVVPSVYLHTFVVYGRLVRQLMPFLVLLSANGLAGVLHREPAGRSITLILLAVVLTQAGWNFKTTLGLAFPRDFVREVQSQYPAFSFSAKRFAFGAPEVCENSGYAVQNAKYFLAAPEAIQVVPGDILLAASHPINFLPYQYEGYTPEQRQAFREAQLRMVFYQLDPEFAQAEDLKQAGIPGCLTR